jgi:hypothetical protein
MGDLLRGYARSDLGAANQWGDGAWIFQTFRPGCLTQAEDYDHLAITVPKEGTDVKAIAAAFFETMTDPATYRSPRPKRGAS